MKNENLQLAENIDIIENNIPIDYEEKRILLNKTKILRQTWSILEIFQKIDNKSLILDPAYQRKSIWKSDKEVPFIESLYMGIIIPPIYVVEIPGDNILDPNRYEVVDGKQRLTTILRFLKNELKLDNRYLEYFGDIFNNKTFFDIQDYPKTQEMLSSVLDIYVIAANSPEFTKYDIFSRINKGAEKLRINEIRKAIYRSKTLVYINDFVTEQLSNNKATYTKLFTATNRDRYEDFGIFYRVLAFYFNTNLETCIVEGYNSRPREMINSTLQKFQNNTLSISKDELFNLLNFSLILLEKLKSELNYLYILDSLIPFFKLKSNLEDYIETILTNTDFKQTLEKSPGTTSNVNKRIKIIRALLEV